jgi:hypothetical protein
VKEQGYTEGLINDYVTKRETECAATVALALNSDGGALTWSNFKGLLIIWGACALTALLMVLARVYTVYSGSRKAMAIYAQQDTGNDDLDKTGSKLLASDQNSDATAHSLPDEKMPLEMDLPLSDVKSYSPNLRRRMSSKSKGVPHLEATSSITSETPSPSSPVLALSPTQMDALPPITSPVPPQIQTIVPSKYEENYLTPEVVVRSPTPIRSVHNSGTVLDASSPRSSFDVLPASVEAKISNLEVKLESIIAALQPK